MNASFDGRPVQLSLQSDFLVLIDPLALDGLASDLIALGTARPEEQAVRLAALGERGLRIGLHQVPHFRPGDYRLDLNSFESADARDGSGVFDLDTGAVVVIDLAAIAPVARALTWDRYDQLLQAPPGDDALLDAINAEVGRPAFALLSGDAASPLSGDGTFRLRATEPRRA